MDRAASLAAEIEKNLGIEASLREGHGGIFEVSKNTQIIYSNQGDCHQRLSSKAIVKAIGEGVAVKKIPRKSCPQTEKVVDALNSPS